LCTVVCLYVPVIPAKGDKKGVKLNLMEFLLLSRVYP